MPHLLIYIPQMAVDFSWIGKLGLDLDPICLSTYQQFFFLDTFDDGHERAEGVDTPTLQIKQNKTFRCALRVGFASAFFIGVVFDTRLAREGENVVVGNPISSSIYLRRKTDLASDARGMDTMAWEVSWGIQQAVISCLFVLQAFPSECLQAMHAHQERVCLSLTSLSEREMWNEGRNLYYHSVWSNPLK